MPRTKTRQPASKAVAKTTKARHGMKARRRTAARKPAAVEREVPPAAAMPEKLPAETETAEAAPENAAEEEEGFEEPQ